MPFAEEHLPELYRLLVNNLNDTAVFLIDIEGRMASWNPGVEQLFGYLEEEFLGRPASILFVPEEIEAGVPEAELLAAASEGRAAGQRWHIRKDGSRLFIDGVVTALKDARGRLIGYSKIMRDITARKRATDELRFLSGAGAMLAGSLDYDTTLRNVARLAVEYVADYCIFHLVTPDLLVKRFTWAHRDAACERLMNGVFRKLPSLEAREHPLGAKLLAGEPVFVPRVTREWMERNLLRPGTLEISTRLGLRSAIVVPVPGRDAVVGFLAFCRDRTSGTHFVEQDLELALELGRRAGLAIENARLYGAAIESEERLKEQERTLRLATEAAGVGIWSWESETRRFAGSEQSQRLFGLRGNRPDLSYEEFLQLVHPEDRGRVDAAVRDALENPDRHDIQFRSVWPDGTVRVLAAMGLARRDENGRTVHLRGVLLDVTERVHREAAAAEAHRLESIGTLAGGVAHEFNNLLTSIIGNASLAAEDVPAGSPAAKRLAEVLQPAERAAELTRQLLAYGGKGRFVQRTLDLSGEVGRIASLLKASVPRRVRLHFDLPAGLPPIEADPSQIQQVAIDLVVNAGEAIGQGGGAVTIRTAALEIGSAAVQERFAGSEIAPGRYVMLEVRDTGCGMDEPIKTRLFEPFFSTKFAGRGMGLAAVRGIVRGHRGAIEVVSAPGQGTTMRAFFPCR